MKGQTLIEALLALTIIAIVVTGIAVTVTSALSNANYGKSQSLATQYAQEGVETLLKIRNKSYSAFATYSGNWCLGKNETALSPGASCAGTPNYDTFIRSVNLDQAPGCGINIAKATITVSWNDGKCTTSSYCHSSKVISCYTNINPIQSP